MFFGNMFGCRIYLVFRLNNLYRKFILNIKSIRFLHKKKSKSKHHNNLPGYDFCIYIPISVLWCDIYLFTFILAHCIHKKEPAVSYYIEWIVILAHFKFWLSSMWYMFFVRYMRTLVIRFKILILWSKLIFWEDKLEANLKIVCFLSFLNFGRFLFATFRRSHDKTITLVAPLSTIAGP